MRIAQALAGFTLGQADVLRKAMGKKDPKVMAKQREAFIEGARAQGRQREEGQQDLRADGVLRRVRLQQVALDGLRVARVSDGVPQGELPVALRRGAADDRGAEHRQARGLPRRVRASAASPVLPPDINESQLNFSVEPEGRAVRPDRDQGARRRRDPRDHRRRARSWAAASRRCTRCAKILDLRLANKRVLEALVKSGACDSLAADQAGRDAGLHAPLRARTAVRVDRRRLRARQPHAARPGSGPGGSVRRRRRATAARRSSRAAGRRRRGPRSSCSTYEKEALGLYWSGHPIDRYADDLRAYGAKTTADLTVKKREATRGAWRPPARRRRPKGRRAGGSGRRTATAATAVAKTISIGGIVSGLRPLKTRKGDRDVRVHARRCRRERRGRGVSRRRSSSTATWPRTARLVLVKGQVRARRRVGAHPGDRDRADRRRARAAGEVGGDPAVDAAARPRDVRARSGTCSRSTRAIAAWRSTSSCSEPRPRHARHAWTSTRRSASGRRSRSCPTSRRSAAPARS